MAGNYAPTITVSPTPLISVTTSDLTSYDEIQETQGTISYQANSIYFQTETIEQVNEPLDLEIYDADGNLKKTKQINPTDPNQYLPVKNINLENDPIIFDGRTRLNLNILPNENIKLYFQTRQVEPSDLLKENTRKFFSEDFLKTYDFFQDYDSEIRKENGEIKEELNGDDC